MLLRDGAIYIASRSVPGALSFATAVLLTWLLPADAYGLYGLGMAAVVLGNAILFEWLCHGVLRWYQSHHEEPRFLPTVLALFAASCLLSALLLAAASLAGLTGEHARLAWLLLFGTWAYGWFEFAARVQICRFRPLRYLAMNLARSGLILAGTGLLAHLTGSGEAVLLVAFTAMLAAGLPLLAGEARRARPAFDGALARSLLAYGAPMLLTMLFSGLMASVSPILIGVLATKEAVGGFTISYTLVQATLMVLAQGINSASWPLAVRAVDGGDAAAARTQLGRNFAFLLGIVLPAGVGLALLAPGIARLLVSPAYHDAVVRITPWLSVCAVLMALRSAYVDFAFQFGRRTGLLARVTAVGALLHLGLGVLLIPRWGALGAAVAMTCAFAVSLAHASLLAPRAYPLPVPLRETAGIVLATALMAVPVTAALALPGPLGLAVQVAGGVATYGAALLALERLGLMPVLRPLVARLLAAGGRRAPRLGPARPSPLGGREA
ncbi:oligosaccharide flippase family protein [Caldovatus aquaticus]|uniref:Lipopolysaccharide biosynthesis protein n=1 Tax=Caldovatus aquaticus TaxID=2865671 RepID=A0ABS7F7K9_9PROT|nr:lipopolysaccharide biosynthesis protein [Caldovatus aquaticus]MBW8271288.1 lipopolysaccharide biosynthesis protein [Caldovatus aquaticus]